MRMLDLKRIRIWYRPFAYGTSQWAVGAIKVFDYSAVGAFEDGSESQITTVAALHVVSATVIEATRRISMQILYCNLNHKLAPGGNRSCFSALP